MSLKTRVNSLEQHVGPTRSIALIVPEPGELEESIHKRTAEAEATHDEVVVVEFVKPEAMRKSA